MLDHLNTYERAKYSIRNSPSSNSMPSLRESPGICSQSRAQECFSLIVGISILSCILCLLCISAIHYHCSMKRQEKYHQHRRQQEQVNSEQIFEDVVSTPGSPSTMSHAV